MTQSGWLLIETGDLEQLEAEAAGFALADALDVGEFVHPTWSLDREGSTARSESTAWGDVCLLGPVFAPDEQLITHDLAFVLIGDREIDLGDGSDLRP